MTAGEGAFGARDERRAVLAANLAAVGQRVTRACEAAGRDPAGVTVIVVTKFFPAADVRRMLTEKPAIAGISAPGMPMGSPGMEGPYPADRYDVVSFDAQGRTAVYASH